MVVSEFVKSVGVSDGLGGGACGSVSGGGGDDGDDGGGACGSVDGVDGDGAILL